MSRTALVFTLLVIVCFLALASVRAEDIRLRDGTVFKNATVTTVTPAYISVMLQDLPADLQKKYGFDPTKAAQFAATDAAAQERLAQQQLAQQQQAAAEQASRQRAAADEVITKNMHTLREVRSDQLSFLNKPFIVDGEIELASYYNWGYEGAEPTHFSFELRTADGSCHVYMERSKAAALRKRLVDSGGSLKGLFSVVLLRSRYRDNGVGDLLLELLDYISPRS